MAGHSRSKNGVASLAYDPAIQLFTKKMDPRVKPAGDGGVLGPCRVQFATLLNQKYVPPFTLMVWPVM
jgi:hypothetical protein